MDSMMLLRKKKNGLPVPDFLGEVTGANFVTYAALRQDVLGGRGSLMADSGWLKMMLDGVIVYVSKTAVAFNITLADVYASGVLYGTDDNGIWIPTGSAARNQRVIYPINGKDYLVKCMTGQDENPSGLGAQPDDGALLSEFSRVFYPLIVGDTRIDNVYTGKKTGSYSNSTLGFNGTGNGAWSISSTWVLNPVNGNNYGYCRGSGSSAYNGGTVSPPSRYTFVGWRPILIEQ